MQKTNLDKINSIKIELSKKIIGQENLIQTLIIGLLSSGHILLEGVPGIAKTLSANSIAKTMDLDFKRVQFTPDLLPSDLIGTEIYNMGKSIFETKKGPLFTNILLADEINRAPSKVQSALLEAMQEKQITIGEQSYILDEPFLVIATQNPIEQNGTYNLPEAELDRFMLMAYVDYPHISDEINIIKNMKKIETSDIQKIINKNDIINLKNEIEKVHVSDSIYEYAVNIVSATRKPKEYNLEDIEKYLSYGVSPRGSIALIKTAKTLAFIEGRDYVLPEDIKEMAISVLAHRLVLNYEALALEITKKDIIQKIIDNIKIR